MNGTEEIIEGMVIECENLRFEQPSTVTVKWKEIPYFSMRDKDCDPNLLSINLEDSVLLGAFLEISEKIQNPQVLIEWKKNGDLYLEEEKNKPEQLLAISFTKEPDKEVRDILKKMKFRWNSFRKEFCGYGNEKELENLLKDLEFTIEHIS